MRVVLHDLAMAGLEPRRLSRRTRPDSLHALPDDVVDLLHGWYPPATAEAWDAVGLVAGDPGAR